MASDLEARCAANDKINHAAAKLPIVKHYNTQEGVIHASADGQKFEARRETFRRATHRRTLTLRKVSRQ